MSAPILPPANTVPVKSNRLPGLLIRGSGVTLSVAGAVAAIVGSILPWLQVPLFGTTVAVPGLLVWGSASLVLALMTLAVMVRVPRLRAGGLATGLLCAWLGWQGGQVGAQAVRRYALETQMRLAPVNARLEQVSIPPVEPFGPSLGQARDWVGPGPDWVFWGGVAMAAGGLLQVGGDRWRRTCARCHTVWASGRDIAFCPRCGSRADTRRVCTACFLPLLKSDRFCPRCGMSAPTPIK